MIAFEISVNGHHIRTIAAGDFGMLNADVMWARIQSNSGPIHEEFRVNPSGLEGAGGDALRWPTANLSIGDAVTIRIVEVESLADPPSERMTQEQIREAAKRRQTP